MLYWNKKDVVVREFKIWGKINSRS